MEFLKGILGDELFANVEEKLKGKDIKLADLSTGNYVGKDKFDVEVQKVKALREQLDAANTQIKNFKDMDIEEVQRLAAEYKTKFEQAEEKAKREIEEIKFNNALNSELSKSKARDIKAVKALLDMDSIKFSNGKVVGLSDQIEKLKTDKDFLFESEDGNPIFSKSSGGSEHCEINDVLRSVMGLQPIKK